MLYAISLGVSSLMNVTSPVVESINNDVASRTDKRVMEKVCVHPGVAGLTNSAA